MGKHDRIGRAGPSEPGLPDEPDDLPVIELDDEAGDAPPSARVPNGTQRRRVVAVAVATIVAAGAVVAVASRDHHHGQKRTAETIVLPAPASTTTQPIGTLDPNAEFVSAVGPVGRHGAWALNTLELALTTDGVNWRSITPPGFGNPADHTSALAFLDARHAWVATDVPVTTIWRTTDGGHSWRASRLDVCGAPCGPIASLDFLDARRGWASFVDERGGTSIATTGDGGATWASVTSAPFLGPIHFVDARRGWATSRDQPGAIFRSSDGGVTWPLVAPADPTATTIAAPAFFGADTAVVAVVDEANAEERVTIWRSTDGGNSWAAFATPLALDTLRHPPSDDRFTATSPTDWTLLDGEHLYVTTDAGAHWKTLTPTQTVLRAVAFASRTEGWLLADIPECGGPITGCIDQYLYRTVDGGQTWTLRSPTVGITANRLP